MNTTHTVAHAVSPEELMAFVDGELAANETQVIEAHLEDCAECAKVVQEFRETSQMLAGWSVPPVPKRVEEAVLEDAIETGIRGRARRRGRKSSAGDTNRRRWKPWVFAGGGFAAVILVGIVVSQQMSVRSRRMMAYLQAPDRKEKMEQPYSYSAAPPPVPASTLPLNGRVMDKLASLSPGVAIGGPVRREGAASSVTLSQPMIARTASLQLIVKDVVSSRAVLETILARHHGYSAQLTVSMTGSDGNDPHSLQASLRVPAAETVSALKDLKTLGQVSNESQSGEDVTQQHVDLAERLKTALDTEARFRAILQQRPGNVSDVLEVEEGIARVRGEIESMEAEQTALEHRVDFATIDLLLGEEYREQIHASSTSLSTRLLNAFVAGYRNAVGTVLGIFLFFVEYGGAILIWVIFLGLPVYLLVRRYRRIRARI